MPNSVSAGEEDAPGTTPSHPAPCPGPVMASVFSIWPWPLPSPAPNLAAGPHAKTKPVVTTTRQPNCPRLCWQVSRASASAAKASPLTAASMPSPAMGSPHVSFGLICTGLQRRNLQDPAIVRAVHEPGGMPTHRAPWRCRDSQSMSYFFLPAASPSACARALACITIVMASRFLRFSWMFCSSRSQLLSRYSVLRLR